MTYNIKISVIIPIYNVEKYVYQCIDSVVNQTYQNFELILVDDGSPDNCPAICDKYAGNDTRIKVIHKKNGGLSSARNAGIQAFSGDYVLFLDGDDYWNSKTFLENAVNYLEKQSYPDVLIFGYTEYDFYNNTKKDYIDFSKRLSGGNKSEKIKSLIENDMYQSSPCNKLIKSKLFKNNDLNFINGIFSEDIDWSARLMIYADSFAVLPETVYIYRQNSVSITHTKKKKNITDLKNNIIRIVKMSEKIKNESYYNYYMNYCAYQYITFLNNACTIDKIEDIRKEKAEMKNYTFLLDYHLNKKVKIIYVFNKLFGYNGMLKFLKIYLKLRG